MQPHRLSEIMSGNCSDRYEEHVMRTRTIGGHTSSRRRHIALGECKIEGS